VDAADASGGWTLVFRDRSSWNDLRAELVQMSGGITGRISIQGGTSTPIGQGTRTGNTLQLLLLDGSGISPAPLEIDATLVGGCLMTGQGASLGEQGGSPFASTFVGFR
jgi:hypothetical protein